MGYYQLMVNEIVLTGKTINYGVAVGRLCLGQHGIPYNIPKIRIRKEEVPKELKKLDSILEKAIIDLNAVKVKVNDEIGKAESEIFETHILILKDPNIIDLIQHHITEKNFNVEWSVSNAFDIYIKKFEEIENEFFRERSHDLVDIKLRLLDILVDKDEKCSDFYGCKRWGKKVIIACKTLLPSIVTKLNWDAIMAIVVEEEVATSHAAIISKAMGIPVICGLTGLVDKIFCGADAVVDADHGKVVLGPSEETRQKYKLALIDKKYDKLIMNSIIKADSMTTDGVEVNLFSNIGSIEKIVNVAKYRSRGIGLLRTEFVFFQRSVAPTEDEQFEIYRKIIEEVGPRKMVTFRVLDIGGDKKVGYLDLKEEENPYLGIRGIRFLLREKVFFKTQLRALMRLSHISRYRILYPMISDCNEVIEIRRFIDEITAELASEGYVVQESNIEHGIMIEVPSAVLMLDSLLPKVDFVSIGTNDLLQYTIGIDRNNRELTSVYNQLSPALLRLIKMIVDTCDKAGKPLSICGEIAGNARYTLPLLGLGIKDFSMTSTMIPYVKDVIINNSMKKAVRIAKRLLKCSSSAEVEEYLSTLNVTRTILG